MWDNDCTCLGSLGNLTTYRFNSICCGPRNQRKMTICCDKKWQCKLAFEASWPWPDAAKSDICCIFLGSLGNLTTYRFDSICCCTRNQGKMTSCCDRKRQCELSFEASLPWPEAAKSDICCICLGSLGNLTTYRFDSICCCTKNKARWPAVATEKDSVNYPLRRLYPDQRQQRVTFVVFALARWLTWQNIGLIIFASAQWTKARWQAVVTKNDSVN